MLNEQIGILVQILLAGIGAIRVCEIFWAGFKSLYRGFYAKRVRSGAGVSVHALQRSVRQG